MTDAPARSNDGQRGLTAVLLATGLFALCAPLPASDDAAVVVFLQPESGVPLFDQVDVEVAIDAVDPEDPVTRAELRFDGGLVSARTEPPWRWTLDVGPHNRDRTLYVDVHTRSGRVVREEFFVPRFDADEELDLGLRQVYATVTDRRGRRVLDLAAGELALEDDGERQEIVTFEAGEIPFTAVLLLDASGSMRGPALATALRGARRFVHSLDEYDEAKVMIFDERLRATSRWLGREHAAELEQPLDEAVTEAQGERGSAVFDYLFLALQRAETRQGRRAVILLSDGWDVHSVLTVGQILDSARRSQSQIYVIRRSNVEVKPYEHRGANLPGVLTSLHPSSKTRSHYRSFERLAEATGGRVLDIETVDEVDGALQEVLQELREQVAVGFYPSHRLGDGTWHELELTSPRSGLKVRTRKGYVDD